MDPLTRAARFVAAGFGSGYSPFAPGTAGSIAAVLAGGWLLSWSVWAVAAAALLATLGGYIAVERARVEGDPGWVTIDEFAGQWIALLALPAPSAAGLIGAFVLFRIFDIAKPGPVGWADRRHGSFGIMADDVVAGLIAAAILVAVRAVRPAWLT